MKTPVTWKGDCFVHERSNDIYDDYKGSRGTLRYERGSGMWLARIRDAVHVEQRAASAVRECERDVARRALDGAIEVLRRRVASDAAWLEAFDKEAT